MTEKEIEYKVLLVIAAHSEYTYTEVKALYSPPQKDPSIDRFFTPAMKVRIARAVKKVIPCSNTTDLTNELFVTITKLKQLIDKVKSYCAPPAA